MIELSNQKMVLYTASHFYTYYSKFYVKLNILEWDCIGLYLFYIIYSQLLIKNK